MAYLDIVGETLILHLSLPERLGGFVRGDAQIPLANVRRARAVPAPWHELRGIRMPGTGIPGRLAIGSWRFAGGKDFVALRGKGEGVVVDLTGVEYARLLVTTRGAEMVAAAINEAAALGHAPPAPALPGSDPYA